MRKFDLSLRSSRSSYFATFRHQLTILSKTDALDEEKWLNMLGTFVKDWFRYESHFVHGRDSLVDVLFFFFKQKTAYEVLRSLVGSEMCIRDRIGSFSFETKSELAHLRPSFLTRYTCLTTSFFFLELRTDSFLLKRS